MSISLQAVRFGFLWKTYSLFKEKNSIANFSLSLLHVYFTTTHSEHSNVLLGVVANLALGCFIKEQYLSNIDNAMLTSSIIIAIGHYSADQIKNSNLYSQAQNQLAELWQDFFDDEVESAEPLGMVI